ncbi:MAG: hypothetical protein ACRDZW_02850 [Acidimicrobiales bacterium]
MGSPRRAVVLAFGLAPLGAVAGHMTGYFVAGQRAALVGSHGHLRPTAWLTVVAAVLALGWAAAARGPRPARLSTAWLAAGQAALFLGLESAEHLAGGRGLGHLLAEPALRWGLVAQVATAAVLVVAAVVARASGERVRARLARRRRFVRPSAQPSATTVVVRSLTLASSASERGPPRTLVSV